MPKKQTPGSMLPDSTAHCLRQLVEQGKARLKLERLIYALALRQEARSQEIHDLTRLYLKKATEDQEGTETLWAHPQGTIRIASPSCHGRKFRPIPHEVRTVIHTRRGREE